MAEEKEYWCSVRDAPCECDKKGCVTNKWSELNEKGKGGRGGGGGTGGGEEEDEREEARQEHE